MIILEDGTTILDGSELEASTGTAEWDVSLLDLGVQLLEQSAGMGSWLSSFVKHNKNTIGAVGGIVGGVVPGAAPIVQQITKALLPGDQPPAAPVAVKPNPPAPVAKPAAKPGAGALVAVGLVAAAFFLSRSRRR